jgi:hypothetical protein
MDGSRALRSAIPAPGKLRHAAQEDPDRLDDPSMDF